LLIGYSAISGYILRDKMHQYKQITILLLVSGVLGCSSSAMVKVVDVTTPTLEQESTAYLGEALISKANGFYTDVLKLGSAIGHYSEINAGVYCRVPETNDFITHNRSAVVLKNGFGNIIDYSNGVTFSSEDNEVCATTGSCYDSNEISIQYKENSFCESVNSFKQVIEYAGRSGQTLKFIYREYSNSLARSSFTTEFSMDLSEDDVIGFKGARIKINDASNSNINYSILKTFNPL